MSRFVTEGSYFNPRALKLERATTSHDAHASGLYISIHARSSLSARHKLTVQYAYINHFNPRALKLERATSPTSLICDSQKISIPRALKLERATRDHTVDSIKSYFFFFF